MNVTLSDSLREFIEHQATTRGYANADAFVEDLVRTESEMLARVNSGAPLPVDEHFSRRLEALLEEAEASGEALEMTGQDWADIRRDGLALLKSRSVS